MCKYVLVIAVIVRQDVDGHFGTTIRLPKGMFSSIMSANLQSDNNRGVASQKVMEGQACPHKTLKFIHDCKNG